MIENVNCNDCNFSNILDTQEASNSNIRQKDYSLSNGLDVLLSVGVKDFCDFNRRNYAYMQYHMLRNVSEKNITLNSIASAGYDKGNPDNLTINPLRPSYAKGMNYLDFVDNINSNPDFLQTRNNYIDSDRYNNVKNHYFDVQDNNNCIGDSSIEVGGYETDKNSILYKTQKLYLNNKINTIISKYYTGENGPSYAGQVRTKDYGESHGRNLLTYNAEYKKGRYCVNGFENPYCRVWTHHAKYERLSDTMRSNSKSLNEWGSNFEWNESDGGKHTYDITEYNNGENYDYAWRGKHNQDRRDKYSVLDSETGMVKYAPSYRGGQEKNIHAKDCMFSIENLAWKDYDPYSFEQALSWEQRGPFGGRIMWFPPYGLTVSEQVNAQWNGNDFIGRGEKVYTYVNTERSGNLSFIMLTDHPSSVDYASWYEGAEKNNSDNDYHRYFAGCNNGKNEMNLSIDNGNSGDSVYKHKLEDGDKYNNDMLIKRPPYMTDEYPEPSTKTLIQPKNNDVKTTIDDSKADTVEFYIFYPNNYSGYYDAPIKEEANVNAITYLLAGINAQIKSVDNNNIIDKSLDINPQYDNNFCGYEMGRKPLTSINVKDVLHIPGLIIGNNNFTFSEKIKWHYRIDYKLVNSTENGHNTINQILHKTNGERDTKPEDNPNYKDTKSFGLNFNILGNEKAKEKLGINGNNDNIYSFAEFACAFYSDDVYRQNNMYNYLNTLIKDDEAKNRVNKLIKLMTTKNLISIKAEGMSNSHGYTINNDYLAKSRAMTAIKWLRGYDKWSNVSVIDNNSNVIENLNEESNLTFESSKTVDENDKFNVNGETSKIFRCAHVVLKFSNENIESVSKTNGKYVGFKHKKSEWKSPSEKWDYYERNGQDLYFEQVVPSDSEGNYSKVNKEGATVNETDLYNMLKNYEDSYEKIEYKDFPDYNDTVQYDCGIDFKKDSEVYYKPNWMFLNLIYKCADIMNIDMSNENDNKELDVYHITDNGNEVDVIKDGCKLYKKDTLEEYNYTGELGNSIDKYLYNPRNWFLSRVFNVGLNEHIYLDESEGLKPEYNVIWKEGTPSGTFSNKNEIETNKNDLKNYAVNNITYSDNEKEFIKSLIGHNIDINNLLHYISGYRLLDAIEYIDMINCSRINVSTGESNTEEDMVEKHITNISGCNRNLWVDRGDGILIRESDIPPVPEENKHLDERKDSLNKLRYDQEYMFYKRFEKDYPVAYAKLNQKLQYFNPAFHSMTPEGFNARLTFLQQCTRQGNTKTMSDRGGKTANNLAFGRPPFCVLRLGDFYNQMIVIDSVSFDYSVSDGLQWDMNTEGNGLQPMLCRVNIGFKFIGGGDITGPVRRLQNAMTFNYYANTSFYDNRADRVEYQDTDWKTMGGAGNNKIDYNKSYAY